MDGDHQRGRSLTDHRSSFSFLCHLTPLRIDRPGYPNGMCDGECGARQSYHVQEQVLVLFWILIWTTASELQVNRTGLRTSGSHGQSRVRGFSFPVHLPACIDLAGLAHWLRLTNTVSTSCMSFLLPTGVRHRHTLFR